MFYGARVVRGPTWQWGDQDGGDGHVGTIIVPEEKYINETDTVWVHWDSGVSANYNCGVGKGCDLRIYDNAQLGVKHKGVRCDACTKWDIEGIRWKCTVCHDFDLCSNCYMSDNHDTKHQFNRIDVPRATPVKVAQREGSTKVKAKGIFPGAKVKRGLKWEWGDQDGGKGNTGDITHIDDWIPNTYRSKVCVKWVNGQIRGYRLGYNGEVDVRYVKGNHGEGGFYYPDHLPELDFENSPCFITPGDVVKVKQLQIDKFKKLQEKQCGWQHEMATVLGQLGKVEAVDKDGDIKIAFTNGGSWFLNPLCLLPERKSDQGRESAESLVDTTDDALDREASTATQLLAGLVLQGILEARTGKSSLGGNPESLIVAAVKGDIDKVTEITKQNPSWVNWRKPDKGYTALHIAAHGGQYDVVSILLSANADKEIPDADEDTALAASCYGNKPSITRLLLNKGSNANAVNRLGKSSLHTAAERGHSACVSALLNHPEVNVNLQDNQGMTPLMRAIDSEDFATIDLIADDPKADFSVRNKKGFNSLHYAAIKGNTHATERIVAKCSHEFVEEQKPDGWTALHLAAFNNHTDVATALVKRGRANMDCRTSKHETPLHLACNKGFNNSIEFLVNGGAKVNLQDDDGDTPLHSMLMKQSIKQFISGTPMEAMMRSMNRGDTSAGNTAAIAIYLIKNGANIFLRNHKGKTVLDCVANPTLQAMLKNTHDQVSRTRPRNLALTTGQQQECKVS